MTDTDYATGYQRRAWCNECQAWRMATHGGDPEESGYSPQYWYCNRCTEIILCDECGYELDESFKCSRPEGHGAEGNES